MDETPQLPDIRTAREILDEAEHATRTNCKNDGRGFQSEIVATAEAYAQRGVAKLEKVDPPTRLVGGGQFRKVIFMANPFLDFAGVWTAHHGRALFIECKSHESGRLGITSSGGISATQWAALKSWRRAGAACAVLWRQKGDVRLFTPEMIAKAEAGGAKSLVFVEGHLVFQGQGRVIWDFLKTLEVAIWGDTFPENKS